MTAIVLSAELERASRQLAKATTAYHWKVGSDKAAALLEYSKRRDHGTDLHARAWELVQLANRGLGAIVRELPKAKPGRKGVEIVSPEKSKSKGAELKDLKITPKRAAELERLAALPAKDFRDWIDSGKAKITKRAEPVPADETKRRQKALSQWFTLPDLAERVWRWTIYNHGGTFALKAPRVLEPSAGEGALIHPLVKLDVRPSAVVAYELDRGLASQLKPTFAASGLPLEVRPGDFLKAKDIGRFDVSVFNPPYEGNLDVEFAALVAKHCTVVVGIFAARIEFSDERAEFWRWHDIVRRVVLAKRPGFGGDFQPMTDFEVLELARRKHARKQGEPSAVQQEWW